MKTSLEKTGSLGRKLTIEVTAEQVSSAFNRVYKGIQQNANIKGFRKGKAPLTMIKSIYSDRVKQDVLQELIAETYTNALNEHDLNPISQPKVNFKDLQEQTPFSFTAEFDVRPEVELKRVEKLKVQKEKLDISDVRVEAVLTQIREARSQIVPIFEERPAKLGDIVEVDFVGTIDGKPLEGGSMNGYKLELGSKSFIPGFEEGLVGVSAGGKKLLNLKFPDDYGHKEIAGKPVQFDVTVKAIMKKDLPELNDEWVKGLGSGQNTVEELKEVIRKDITAEESKRIQDDLKNRILKALAAENPVETPTSLKDEQKALLVADVEKRLKSQGMTDADVEEYKSKWDKDFDETATFMVQSSFLIDTIAKKQKLTAKKEDIEERLEKYSKQTGIELDKLKDFYLHNHDRKHQLEYQITEEKVVNYLIDNAEIKEVSAAELAKN